MAFEIENGVLVKYTEEEGVTEVVIPEGVTKIGDEAFADCAKLRKVTIPESVTEIGEYAFMNCSFLADVNIPKGVKKIGGGAFAYCASINHIEFPDDIEEFPTGYYCKEGVFYEGNLRSVKLPKNLKILGTNSFEGNALETIELPEGLEVIGDSAFAANSLTSVIIPDSVRIIEDEAFSFNKIKSISFGDKLDKIGSSEDTLGSVFECGENMDITKRYTLPICCIHITYNASDFADWEECRNHDEYTNFYEFICRNSITFDDFELNPNYYLDIKKISVLRDNVCLDFVSYDDYIGTSECYVDDYSYYYCYFGEVFSTVMECFESWEKAENNFKNAYFYNKEKIILAIFGTLFYTESETFSDYLKQNLDEAKKYLNDTNNTAAAEKLRAMGYAI